MEVAWISLAGVIALATGVAAAAVTRWRMERQVAELRQSLAEAHLLLVSERKQFEEREKTIEEHVRRTAMDQFLSEMRVEERHYVRQHRLLFAHRRSLVMQERVFFRNVPLSTWVEHEVPLEEGASADDLAKTLSVFQKALELDSPKNERPFRLLFR